MCSRSNRHIKMAAKNPAILYAYWLSSCSWRVRAALHAKKILFEERSVDIVQDKKQLSEQYRTINPAQKVPTLIIDGVTLVESLAIIEYLEETHPEPSLLPNDALQRARTREICQTVVAGIQPLQNYGLKSHFPTEEQFIVFTKYWSERGLQTLENLLEKSAGRYSVGDQITVADICVVPQLYNAVTRYKIDISKYPTVSRIYNTLLEEELFKNTHPKKIKHEN
ncbi:hypothetical protein K1T71_003137 [Dendrolimus kikuchii]|uniref:Uncharacterized protein n=1 Tax=Dendrolimus kikuchii TaxID=765133 RepID=A0ACC1DB06_9NEOP|nr:hypothetical protein K1T71_003137 [Dendrolimus kikuchii]